MAGLFELQLPNETRSRRSQDVSEPRLSTSRARSNSPPPQLTASQVVAKVVAKQQAEIAAAQSSSIFPWRRRATGSDPSRKISDASSRNSTEVPRRSGEMSNRTISQSLDQQEKPVESHSSLHTPAPAAVPSYASSSIDFTLIPSTPGPQSSSPFIKDEHRPPRAASALAHAGLGLGLPPISFPGPSSPVSGTSSAKRKKIERPGTAHGGESTSMANSSLKVQTVRRAKSFSRQEGVHGIDKQGKKAESAFISPTSSGASHIHSLPDWSLHQGNSKGKGKERDTNNKAGQALEEDFETVRGRPLVDLSPLNAGGRDTSATRRTSWWPGRKRVDSLPVTEQTPFSISSPTPLRSQSRPSPASGRMTPSLPSFRPFSPLMADFRLTESPGPSAVTFEGLGSSVPRRLDDITLNFGSDQATPIRRRHSLNNRTSTMSSHFTPTSHQTASRPPSQIYIKSHRYSQSLSSPSEETSSSVTHSTTSPAIASPPSSADGTISGRSQPAVSLSRSSTRRRSMTINSPQPVPQPSQTREIPLLLRQLHIRPHSSTDPPDPFLTERRTNTRPRLGEESPDAGALAVGPVDMQRTPSTSSGSTSSLSNTVPAGRSPRQRAGTTPPATWAITTGNASLPPPSSGNGLLRRLSSTFFSPSSTLSSPVEPSLTDPSPMTNMQGLPRLGADTSSPTISDMSSPHRSKESLSGNDGTRTSGEVQKVKATKFSIRVPNETPEAYVKRLVDAVGKAEIAHVLAANGDEFHAQALRLYIERFDFLDDPLDVALRKLLMDMGLPRETQQIDRVMEAFAMKYLGCNSGLYMDDDHPYILAFSLIMLHTDTFNKSNKNKMTKTDYVKNTRLPGLPPEVLECFFDNTVFAPFIFIEDPVDTSAPKGYLSEGSSRLSSFSAPSGNASGASNSATGSTILGKSNKIDPYYLITQGLLGPLRADVDTQIPRLNPYQYEGTDWPWDTRGLHIRFALTRVIHVGGDSSPTVHSNNASAVSTPARRKSIALPSLGAGYTPLMAPPSLSSDGLSSPPKVSTAGASRGAATGALRITKAGVLTRKEDLAEGGKKSTNRKWREWSVVLTRSQLLFYRDINFTSQLFGRPPLDNTAITVTEPTLLNPDEVVSLHDCIAVFDTTYTKYANTFRFVLSNGRQFLMQAPDEKNLNEWISTINYASAFKTAGIQMRGLGMTDKDVEMTGMAAAASHLHDLRASSKAPLQTLVHAYGSPDSTSRNMELLPSHPPSSGSSPKLGPGTKLLRSFNGQSNQVDLEATMSRDVEGAEQLKVTFDEVKAELVAHSLEQSRSNPPGRMRTLSISTRLNQKSPSRPGTAGSGSHSEDSRHLTARSDIIRSRIETWSSQISSTQVELDAELRIARNLSILTPFQRTTRDRIQLAVGPLAGRIRSIRLALTKLTCYRHVLKSDLVESEREREQAKRDALKAATHKLSTADEHVGPALQVESESSEEETPEHGLEVPVRGSFYSALDGYEWNQSGNLPTPLSMLSEDEDATDFPFPPSHSSTSRDSNATPTRSTANAAHSDIPSSPVDGHERFYTAVETPEEVAEEWNETRAAKRVSLVKLPDVRMSAIRYSRNPEDDGRRRLSSRAIRRPDDTPKGAMSDRDT